MDAFPLREFLKFLAGPLSKQFGLKVDEVECAVTRVYSPFKRSAGTTSIRQTTVGVPTSLKYKFTKMPDAPWTNSEKNPVARCYFCAHSGSRSGDYLRFHGW